MVLGPTFNFKKLNSYKNKQNQVQVYSAILQDLIVVVVLAK